jgi:hypothetical protein
MKLESVDTIYHDGGHNAFTDIVQWKGKYWVCFRNAQGHRSIEGRICVISSPNLKDWSEIAIPINTPEDNRDPKLLVFCDRLYVSSMTIKRSFEIPETWEGRILTDDFFSLISCTDDGVSWSKPHRVWDPFKGLWWTDTHGGRAYGSGHVCTPVDDRGNPLPGSSHCETNSAEFVVSDDGLEWKTLSVISQDREPSECALAFLPDGRAVGFLRHNLEQNPFPEIVVAKPPYTKWEVAYSFPYWTNGPCLGMVGDTVVASSRAMLDWDSTPQDVVSLAEAGAVRGLQIMTVDVDEGRVTPELVISCPPHPEDDWPDVSYAGILDLGGGEFVMTYYQGLKVAYSDIKLARLRL